MREFARAAWMTVVSGLDHKALLRTMSGAPGVYAMLDGQGRFLYVGKARNLKKRLSSYFRGHGRTPRTEAMLSHVDHIETIVTRTESEALLLENNLIKAERPRYNVVLRDDKSYPYIRLTVHDRYPRLAFYRGARKASGRYFGPYPSAAAVRETLAELQKVFPLRQCEDGFFRNRTRPCLQYQIERCSAPCVRLVDDITYADDVEQAVLFLEGRSEILVNRLAARMEVASRSLEFEAAARYRDRIAAVRRIQERQYMTNVHGGDVDLIAVAVAAQLACIAVNFVRGGRQLGTKFFFSRVELELGPAAVLEAFLPQYYLGKAAPDEILLSDAVRDTALLGDVLSENNARRTTIRSAVRGTRARWLDHARVNAADALRQRQAQRAGQVQRLESLREALELDEVPERLECFDISHTQGEKAVASCVVFDRQGAVKSDYRRFNVTPSAPGDDYAAMREALTRRYRRLRENEQRLPDVLIIDGGKGQLRVAESVLAELQVSAMCMIGVAKGESRRPGEEQIFLTSRRCAIRLEPGSKALLLIQQIRDEAHRFAITGHRQRRATARRESSLQEIPGIGPTRRRALLRHFGGLRGVARAGVEELSKAPGISPVLAQRIYHVFH